MPQILAKYFSGISPKEVSAACEAAYTEYERHMAQVRSQGAKMIEHARANGMPIIVLAGRPYHVDLKSTMALTD